MMGLYGDSWWREILRMSNETFEIICNELQPHLQRQETRFRHPVTVEARVAVTIRRLATNVEYQIIAALFGLGRSTVGEIVIDTCEAINNHFMSRYIRVPHEDSLRDIVDGFKHQWGFPQAIGAIDGTHIPILRPQESVSDYYNRKGYYSVLMQGVIDFRGSSQMLTLAGRGKCMTPGSLSALLFIESVAMVTCFRTGTVTSEE